MKNSILISLVGILFFVSCNNLNDNKNVQETNVYDLSGDFVMDSSLSFLNWKASKVGLNEEGKIYFNQGSLSLDSGKVINGHFTININSLVSLNAEKEKAKKLEYHLKNEDFFQVKKFPLASLKILSNQNETITADLTIKDKTKTIHFPVRFIIL